MKFVPTARKPPQTDALKKMVKPEKAFKMPAARKLPSRIKLATFLTRKGKKA